MHAWQEKYLQYPHLLCLLERRVDGEAFSHLSREDLATVFSDPANFIMASKLYKIIQRVRFTSDSSGSTQELLADLGEVEDMVSRHGSTSHLSSTPSSCSSSGSTSTLAGRKRLSPLSQSESAKRPKRILQKSLSPTAFELPVFSPDVSKCIQKDAFYSTTQRNKLIKEPCTALRGFCWAKNETMSNENKRMLARMLLELAPKSLGDASRDRGTKGAEVSC